MSEKPLVVDGYGLPEFRAYEDAVAFGIECREGRDSFSWPLGDAILKVCAPPSNGGRPRNGSEAVTLAAYCRDIGISSSTGSGLRDNSIFWTMADRAKMPPQISWFHASEARRRSGWRPTQGEPTAQQRELAWRFIGEYAEETPATVRQVKTLAEKLERVRDGLYDLSRRDDAAEVMRGIHKAAEEIDGVLLRLAALERANGK